LEYSCSAFISGKCREKDPRLAEQVKFGDARMYVPLWESEEILWPLPAAAHADLTVLADLTVHTVRAVHAVRVVHRKHKSLGNRRISQQFPVAPLALSRQSSLQPFLGQSNKSPQGVAR